MTDHVTQQVLDAVVAAVTGLSTTGVNVFVNHPQDRALQASEIPALLVYLGAEEVQNVTLDGTIVERTTHFYVDVRIKGIGAIDETLTEIRKEVETVLGATFTIGGRPVILDYVGMAEPELDSENDQPMISARLEFTAALFNVATAPDVLI